MAKQQPSSANTITANAKLLLDLMSEAKKRVKKKYPYTKQPLKIIEDEINQRAGEAGVPDVASPKGEQGQESADETNRSKSEAR